MSVNVRDPIFHGQMDINVHMDMDKDKDIFW